MAVLSNPARCVQKSDLGYSRSSGNRLRDNNRGHQIYQHKNFDGIPHADRNLIKHRQQDCQSTPENCQESSPAAISSVPQPERQYAEYDCGRLNHHNAQNEITKATNDQECLRGMRCTADLFGSICICICIFTVRWSGVRFGQLLLLSWLFAD